MESSIRVLVRVRPLNERELRSNPSDDGVLQIRDDFNELDRPPRLDFGCGEDDDERPSSGGTICIPESEHLSAGVMARRGAASAAPRSFAYDAVFGTRSTQEDIYRSVEGIVDAVCEGYNGTIVAYGQTGSGKTHTIVGGESGSEDAGLVERSVGAIFNNIAESISNEEGHATCTAKASFFEIYNERVYDLLSSKDLSDAKGLSVREDRMGRVYVEGLSEVPVDNSAEAMAVLDDGTRNRSTAATKMNRVSSRSHAVFALSIEQEFKAEDGSSTLRQSSFTLVDLAGSERQKTTDTTGSHLKEANMINNSLLCLGQVITSLVRKQGSSKPIHVPFRDSNLTYILRDSLGGNSKTCLVATVTPSLSSLSETISTLSFAQKAKLVHNTAVLNESIGESTEALKAEIERLRSEIKARDTAVVSSLPPTPSAVTSPLAARGFETPAKGFKTPAKGGELSSLLSENDALSRKVKAQNTQMRSIRRKLQQESMIRQFKERRLNSLLSARKVNSPTGEAKNVRKGKTAPIIPDEMTSITSDETESTTSTTSLEMSITSLTVERDFLKKLVDCLSSDNDETKREYDDLRSLLEETLDELESAREAEPALHAKISELEEVVREQNQTNLLLVKRLEGPLNDPESPKSVIEELKSEEGGAVTRLELPRVEFEKLNESSSSLVLENTNAAETPSKDDGEGYVLQEEAKESKLEIDGKNATLREEGKESKSDINGENSALREDAENLKDRIECLESELAHTIIERDLAEERFSIARAEIERSARSHEHRISTPRASQTAGEDHALVDCDEIITAVARGKVILRGELEAEGREGATADNAAVAREKVNLRGEREAEGREGATADNAGNDLFDLLDLKAVHRATAQEQSERIADLENLVEWLRRENSHLKRNAAPDAEPNEEPAKPKMKDIKSQCAQAVLAAQRSVSQACNTDRTAPSTEMTLKKRMIEGARRSSLASLTRTPLGKSSHHNIQPLGEEETSPQEYVPIGKGDRVRVLSNYIDCFGEEAEEWHHGEVTRAKMAEESISLRIKFVDATIKEVEYPNEGVEKIDNSEPIGIDNEALNVGDSVDCYFQDGNYKNGAWSRGKVARIFGDSCDVLYPGGYYESNVPMNQGKIRLMNHRDSSGEWMAGRRVLLGANDANENAFRSGTVAAVQSDQQCCIVTFSDGSSDVVSYDEAADAVFRSLWKDCPPKKRYVWPVANTALTVAESIKLRHQTRNRQRAIQSYVSPKKALKKGSSNLTKLKFTVNGKRYGMR